ncbi:MAG: hypothetical protein NVS3B25_03710 [Hymenobacter sp.]
MHTCLFNFYQTPDGQAGGRRLARLLSLVLLLLVSGTAWAQSTAPEGGTLSPATSTVCAGINSGTLTLSGYAGTIVKYQVDNGSGYNDVALTTPTYTYQNLQTTTTFRAIVSTSTGVLVASTVATVTVNSAPTATITASGATTFCKQGNLFLSAGPMGSGLTYQFLLNGNAIAGATGQTYSALVTSSGNYSVRVTNASGCSATSPAVAVTVDPRNVVNLSAATATTFCQGGSVLLSANTTGPGASDYTYQYYRNDVPVSGATASTYTATTSGTYTVVVYNPTTCTSTSDPITVTVQLLANSSVSYPAATYCQNAGTTPTPTVATTGGSFTASPSGLSISATTGVVNLAASTPGTYTITYSVGGSCPSSSTATLTINAATTAAFSYSAASFCQSGTAPIPTVTGTAGGTFSSTTGLRLNATTGTIDPTASTPGTYTVTYSVAGPCPSSATASVTITAAPVATFSYAAGSNCAGTTGTVAATLASGATAGTFSSTTGLSLNATTGAIDLSTSTPGTYTVTNTLAAANGCAATSATATITINALPTPTLTAGGATTFCQGGSVTLTAAGGAPGSTYQFLLNGQPIAGATTSTYTASTAGAYSVTITNPSSCAATSAATTVTVNALAIPTVSYTAASFCQNGTTNPAPTVSIAGGTFASTTGLTLDATTGVITLGTSTPGTYIVTYTGGSPCPGSGTTTVTVAPLPSAAFAYGAPAYCKSATTNPTATVTGTTGGTFSSTTGLSLNATTGEINLATSTAGTYTITYSVAGPCSTSSTATVTVTNPAVATFSYAAAAYCLGTSPVPTLATGATAGTFSALPAGLVLNASTGAIDLATSQAGTYTITNTLAAAGGCTASSATASVTLNAAPARPVLTAAYNGSVTTLSSSSATGNQFYFNGTAIAGATAQTYVVNGAPAQLGSYTVVVTNAGGCASLASAPLVVTAALRPLAGTALNVYPTPTPDGRLTLELSGYRKATELTVLNALGQVVRRMQVPVAADGNLALPLDLSALPQGVYTLRLLTEGGTATRRIVRE